MISYHPDVELSSTKIAKKKGKTRPRVNVENNENDNCMASHTLSRISFIVQIIYYTSLTLIFLANRH